MSYLDLRRDVLDADLCTSCGGCVAVCPEDLLTIDVDDPVPRLVVAADDAAIADRCGTCDRCVEICPGRDTGVAASEQRMFGRTRRPDERWTGITRRSLLASAVDDDVLTVASAGGAVTALLLTALRSGLIDAALVIGRDVKRPWIPAPLLANTEAELLSAAQASYAIAPNLQLLRDTSFQRVAVVGLACQMQAVSKMRNAGMVPPADRIALTVEIACSSNTRLTGTEHLISNRLGIPLTNVKSMRYRSGAYPGEFTVEDSAGSRHTLPFYEVVLEFTKFKTFRCLACPDWWSGLADLSIADGDPNIFRASRTGKVGVASSRIITRTAIGDDLVDLCVRRGELKVTDDPFIPEQSLGLQRKRNRYLRYRRDSPERIPTDPMPCSPAADETVEPLDDGAVIEQMSSREPDG